MSTSKFQAALRKSVESKSVDQLLVGSNANYLPEGSHDVVIQSIDTTQISEHGIDIIFLGAEGKAHKERFFLMEYNGEEVSRQIRNLWAATIPNKDAIAKFIDEIMEDNFKVFDMLTGAKLRIVLQRAKKGFITKVDSEGSYAAYDVESGEKLTEDFPKAKDAQETAKASGLKQAYVKVYRQEVTNAESNIATFNLAIEAERKAKNSSGGSGSPLTGAGTGRTSLI